MTWTIVYVCGCGCDRRDNPQGQRPLWCEISWEGSNITCQPLTLCVTLKTRGRIIVLSVLHCFPSRTWAVQRKLSLWIGQTYSRVYWVGEAGSKVGVENLSEIFFSLYLTFPCSLVHLPLYPITTCLSLLFHPWRCPTVFVCLFLTLLSPPANLPAFTPHPLLPHLSQSRSVCIFHQLQVWARVVLSFSGFAHSRYYHQTPVSLADSHLGRSIT